MLASDLFMNVLSTVKISPGTFDCIIITLGKDFCCLLKCFSKVLQLSVNLWEIKHSAVDHMACAHIEDNSVSVCSSQIMSLVMKSLSVFACHVTSVTLSWLQTSCNIIKVNSEVETLPPLI